MADHVPGVSDKDLAMYQAIVGGRKTPGPAAPVPPRQAIRPRLDVTIRLAQRRILEGLRRFGFRP